jgi:hypothetical protein
MTVWTGGSLGGGDVERRAVEGDRRDAVVGEGGRDEVEVNRVEGDSRPGVTLPLPPNIMLDALLSRFALLPDRGGAIGTPGFCKLMRISASFGESVLGFESARRSFCARARDVGEGGRGGGNMACASARVIVWMLLDDRTGAVRAQHGEQEGETIKPHRCNPS